MNDNTITENNSIEKKLRMKVGEAFALLLISKNYGNHVKTLVNNDPAWKVYFPRWDEYFFKSIEYKQIQQIWDSYLVGVDEEDEFPIRVEDQKKEGRFFRAYDYRKYCDAKNIKEKYEMEKSFEKEKIVIMDALMAFFLCHCRVESSIGICELQILLDWAIYAYDSNLNLFPRFCNALQTGDDQVKHAIEYLFSIKRDIRRNIVVCFALPYSRFQCEYTSDFVLYAKEMGMNKDKIIEGTAKRQKMTVDC